MTEKNSDRPADTELVELVKHLIANIGHPVGMGIGPSANQAETIIKAIRKYDAEFDAKQAGETATIPVDVVGAQNKFVMLGGKILVSKSMLDAYGPDFFQKLNDSQNAVIVVIDDDSYKEMTPSERVEFLNTVAV